MNGPGQAETAPGIEDHDGQGRSAERPADIPPRGWWDILKRVKTEMKEDNLTLIAAGVAFYAMLALFPAIIALVTVYGLVSDPDDVQQQLGDLAGGLPEEAQKLLNDQLGALASAPDQGLTLGLLASLAGVVWSASGAVQTMITGLNVVYDERETRGFVRLRGLALLLTVGALVVAVVALALVAAFPVILDSLGLSTARSVAANVVRWVLLAVLVTVGLAVLYRFAPDRDNPHWRWVSWGAVGALALWLAGSAAFSFYVGNFGTYDKTYGSLAAAIILMLWLWLSSLAALLGAEADAEIERQTAKDTTTGPNRAVGERGAEAADTPGKGADTG